MTNQNELNERELKEQDEAKRSLDQALNYIKNVLARYGHTISDEEEFALTVLKIADTMTQMERRIMDVEVRLKRAYAEAQKAKNKKKIIT